MSTFSPYRTLLRRLILAAILLVGLVPLGTVAARQATPAASPVTDEPFVISAIPDQDVAVLNRQFGAMADYLAAETGLRVQYAPMVDYAALVTAFERGDVQLGWFGGLTGVQARAAVPDAQAIAQRPRDAEFRSQFIVRADLPVKELTDLEGLSFAFGSESSTSGHLMPRYFLGQAGIVPEEDFAGLPNYSGSHDRTIALVEGGAFDAGVLNGALWEQRVAEGAVDATKVRAFQLSPPYFDYNWTIRGDLDATYGDGTAERVRQALLELDPALPEQRVLLDLFQTDAFVPTENANYDTIVDVAEQLGILR